MIQQQRQVLNDNDLHTLIYKGEIGINQLLISRLSGMHLLDVLSISNFHSPDATIKEHLFKTVKQNYKSDQEFPKLIQRYELTLAIIDSELLNEKQYISLYATIMKTKIKEFFTNQKNQLFCNVYVPPKYTKTLKIFCYSPNLTGYLPLVTTDQMNNLIIMEEKTAQIDNQQQMKCYTFDQIFQDIVLPQINNTPEKDQQKLVRRHKKSLSEHQIFDFQREQKEQQMITQIQSIPQDRALFFSQTKQQTFIQDDYQFPSLDQINSFKPFSIQDEKKKIEQSSQQTSFNIQRYEDGIPNLDDLEFFPPLDLLSTASCPSLNNKLQMTDQKKQSTNPIYTGRLKFFDEQKNYGFIVMDEDKSDIFVHLDDLQKAGVTKETLKTSKQGSLLRFQFNCMVYVGKYKKSRKAVELKLLANQQVNNFKEII
ncbi:unnamed protein product [Paramecium primaurelia]|uniref:CSD domain-containing protein n=1 Tax=Paramecium primaurelia TaxID=5886 RepID=A0A8S1NR01_PARPR|nr:unnamed protein product [Paramecium primaurelia]